VELSAPQSQATSSAARRWSLRHSRSGQQIILNGLTYLALIVWGIVFMIPLVWMLSTSLKVTGQEFRFPPQWLPNPVMWENYYLALTALPFHIYFKNTMIIIVGRLIGTLLTASMAAYAFGRLRFPLSGALFALVLSVMILPGMVTLVPTYLLFNEIGWIDTLYPLIVPYLISGAPRSAFFIFLLRQFFLTVPVELEDAGKIDGASYLRIFWQIVLPLAKPALGAVAIFVFVEGWNEFDAPLIYLQSENVKTMALGVYTFRGLYDTAWNYTMAASMAMVVPVLLVFFYAQRYFISGISMTGFGGR